MAPKTLARARNLADSLAGELPYGFNKMKTHFVTAQKAALIIEEELKQGWPPKSYQKLLELGAALVHVLVAFLEILQMPIPDELLTALRQPGLLKPVNKYSPNSLGIYGLIGHVW
jgi:hypothetical protein